MLFEKSPSKMTDEEKLSQIEAMYAAARAKAFPGVPEISAKEIIDRRQAGDKIILVDVRTPEEQAVSVIPGSITLEQFETNTAQHDDATIVCYCTIGGRSGKRTAELCARGIKARNMPGSVLSWSHAGGQFVDASGEPTKRIHVHGPKFNLVADGYEGVW